MWNSEWHRQQRRQTGSWKDDSDCEAYKKTIRSEGQLSSSLEASRQVSKHLSIHFLLLMGFLGFICCALQFSNTLVPHKYATYSLMCFSLVSAIVLLRALNPWGTPGDTPVTVLEPTNQCTDTQPYSPSSPELYCRIKGSQKEEDYPCFSQGSATLIKDELDY